MCLETIASFINFISFRINLLLMQKQLTLTDIKAVFTKDFQTFGKMDPFLVFTIGKSQAKTQTANDAGKQPVWKATIVLTYFDEPTIIIKSYEEDLSTNQYMGQGRIDVKGLKNTGTLQFKISQQNANVIGTVTCKYSMKTLPPTPILFIKNIKCDFYKETKFLLKTKPYFSVSCGGKTTVSEVKKQGNATLLSWDETLRVKVKDGQKVVFSVEDKNDQNKKIFGYETQVKQFRTLTGTKSYNVIDKNFEPLGTIEFQYETQHLVNKEESVKNEENLRKQANQMYHITIEKIKGNLNQSDQDIYFKINTGPTMIKTPVHKNAKKDFVMQLKQTIYSQRKQNKIIFAAYDKDLTYDDFLGSGELPVEGLTSSDKIVSLKNAQGQHFGDIVLTLIVKKVICKTIVISDIQLKLAQGGDLIGKSDPFVNAQIGGWTGRTQTSEGEQVKFQKSITLKFSDEKQILFQVYDEDININEFLYQEKVNIEGFKDTGEHKIILKKQGEKDEKKKSELSFKYTSKNLYTPPKKQQPKKSQKVLPAEQPKKEEIPDKKQESKPIKKQQPVQQNKIVEQSPKKEQTINNSSLNKSRNTIKLPIIDKNNYGDRIFYKQSAATLQKSILVYSMPKADRFATHGPKYVGEPSYYVDSCFKPNSGKGVGFGFGNKKQFPDWMQKNMKQNPAPGSYIGAHDKSNEIRPKGPTFGISYKFYEKVTIPKQKAYRSTQRLNPIAHLKKSD